MSRFVKPPGAWHMFRLMTFVIFYLKYAMNVNKYRQRPTWTSAC